MKLVLQGYFESAIKRVPFMDAKILHRLVTAGLHVLMKRNLPWRIGLLGFLGM